MNKYARMLQEPMTKREQIVGVLWFYDHEDVDQLMEENPNPYTFQNHIRLCIVDCFLNGDTVGYRADVLRAAYKDFVAQSSKDFPTISNNPDDGLYL